MEPAVHDGRVSGRRIIPVAGHHVVRAREHFALAVNPCIGPNNGRSSTAELRGTLDDEHHLTISDRKKDVIITGGENVSSIEVEDCLMSHPCVAEVAVIGIPDNKWGETIKALVVLRPGTDPTDATEQALLAHCRASLAHFKCPTSVEMRDALTRTATGKLQKFLLRAPYWEGRTRQVN